MKPRNCKYDRGAIMRRAHELKSEGMAFGDAMKMAWAEAREAKAIALNSHPKAQPAGARAALRRYGVDVDKAADLAARAVATVKRVAAEAIRRTATPVALPRYDDVIVARKGEDGVYRF